MRGQQRTGCGRQRSGVSTQLSSQLLRFATEDLPATDRVALWREVMGRTLTGCQPSSLANGELRVDFTIAVGDQLRLGRTQLGQIRNFRDRSCLRDGDDDLIFFLLLDGTGELNHRGSQVRLGRGDGMLARFDQTLDTSWPSADLMLFRLSRDAVASPGQEHSLATLLPQAHPLMRLLTSYAQAAWQEAVRTGELAPIADRQLSELIAALCAAQAGRMPPTGTPAIAAARLAAMREQITRRYADPCLSMLSVAGTVGLSERAGYLVFEHAGLSFSDELYASRLDAARERLWVNPDERVANTAFAVGFSDVSHFYRLFRRRFGRTPGEVKHGGATSLGRHPDDT